MKFGICKVDEVSLSVGERSRRYGRGALVDLDEVVVPAVKGTKKTDPVPAQTVRDILGARVDAFTLIEADTLSDAAILAERMTAGVPAPMTTSDASDPSPVTPSPSSPIPPGA